MAKILVTGGMGFIGSFLVAELKKEHKVIIIDLKNGTDIRTSRIPDDFDLVFHLAALRSVPKSFEAPRDYFDTNVYGTYRVLESNPNARIINISTSSANNPIAPYGLSKMLAEHIAKRHKRCVSLRLFNPFGEGGKCPDLVIPIFAEAMMNDQPVYIHSDGKQDRDFTYVHDVVSELMHYGAALSKTGIYEVGYGQSVSVNEVFDIMAKFFNYKREPIYIPRRIGDQVHTKAKTEMNIKPIGFHEGLRRTMEWYADSLHTK